MTNASDAVWAYLNADIEKGYYERYNLITIGM